MVISTFLYIFTLLFTTQYILLYYLPPSTFYSTVCHPLYILIYYLRPSIHFYSTIWQSVHFYSTIWQSVHINIWNILYHLTFWTCILNIWQSVNVTLLFAILYSVHIYSTIWHPVHFYSTIWQFVNFTIWHILYHLTSWIRILYIW